MYGWRARIGYIVPSSGTVMEAEWRRVTPEGVHLVGSRVLIDDVSVEGLRSASRQLDRAAREVASAGVDAIVQVGTPVGFVAGPRSARALADRLQRITGVPTITMIQACVEALHHLHLARIAVATPYIDELNVLLRGFLEASGFEVLSIKGLGIRSNSQINAVDPGTVYRAARDVFTSTSGADGVFISSGGWPTFDVLRALETDLAVPVVSSNSAALWRALQLAGVNEAIPGLGTLLAHPTNRPTGNSSGGEGNGT